MVLGLGPKRAARDRPSLRAPVPPSMTTTSLLGSVSSRQVVLPPKPRFSGAGVGIEPRTPQNVSSRRDGSFMVGGTRPMPENRPTLPFSLA